MVLPPFNHPLLTECKHKDLCHPLTFAVNTVLTVLPPLSITRNLNKTSNLLLWTKTLNFHHSRLFIKDVSNPKDNIRKWLQYWMSHLNKMRNNQLMKTFREPNNTDTIICKYELILHSFSFRITLFFQSSLHYYLIGFFSLHL